MEKAIVSPYLLEVLACPVCHSDLEPVCGAIAGLDEGLRCRGCRRIYPVRDGIPVMLVDQARMDDRASDS